MNDLATPSLRDRFENIATTRPNHRAVGRHDGGWLTFGELDAAANALAARLIDRGVQRHSPVGILLDRSPSAVVAILAIWKAGGAYVPIDPSAPAEFIRHIIDDSAIRLLLLGSPPTIDVPTHIDAVHVPDEPNSFDSTRPVPPVVNHGNDPAWIIYTSGSTGRPKGVIGTHRGSLTRCRWLWERHPFTPEEISVQNTALTVVDSVWEIWGSLTQAIPVVLPLPNAARDPSDYLTMLYTHRVSRICVVPSLLRTLLDVAHPLGERVPDLKHWVSSGERLDRTLVERFHQDVPGAVLHNQYGLTETCADITSFDTKGHDHTGHDSRPIGQPTPGTTAYILDEALQLLTTGESGELYIAGDCLSMGYANNPRLTAQRFLANPHGSLGTRMFRTGDLARDRGDGVLEHIGRIDRQVQIRGFRVEPAAVESVLNRQPGVRTAAVHATPNGRLAAYIVATEPEHAPSINNLRRRLAEQLPHYMMPSTLALLSQLPQTASGKTDYGALPASTDTLAQDHTPPRTPTHRWLASMWSTLLNIENPGITDNFFELGGHSLDVMHLLSKIASKTGKHIQYAHFSAQPTITGATRLLGATTHVPSPTTAADRSRPAALSHTQKSMWLQEQLSDRPGLYNITLAFAVVGTLDTDALGRALDALVAAHESLRTTIVTTGAEPLQHETQHVKCPLRLTSLASADTTSLAQLLLREREQPFELTQAPMIRCHYLATGTDNGVLALTVHHLVCDGQSLAIVLADLAAAYAAAIAHRRITLNGSCAPRPTTTVSGPRVSRQLPDRYSPLRLATDHPHPARPTNRGATVDFDIDPKLTARTIDRSTHIGSTPFVMICGALGLALGAHTNQEKFSLAIPVANRLALDTLAAVGCLMRVAHISIDLSANLTVADYLRNIHDAVSTLHTPDPLHTGAHEIDDPARVMLAYDLAHAQTFTLAGLDVSPMPVAGSSTKMDMTVLIDQGRQSFHGTIEYSTALFDPRTITLLVEHFRTALEKICANRPRRLAELSVLTAAEHRRLHAFNQTARDNYPLESSLPDLIELTVTNNPDSLVSIGDQHLTHHRINATANRLARALRSLGCRAGDVVGIHLARSIELIAAVLAVIKAGCAYLPLEPDLPGHRLRNYVIDSSAHTIVTDRPTQARETFADTPAHIVAFEDLDASAAGLSSDPMPSIEARAPAYVIFTSGSTGRPKGVLVTHRSLLNRLCWLQETFALDASDCLLFKTPIGADPSVEELFWPFISGARLQVALPGRHLDPAYMAEIISTAGVSVVRFVPSMLRLFVEHALPHTRLARIFCGGEELPPDLVDQVFHALDVEIYNFYGPTETTIDVCWWRCRPEATPHTSIPIGLPIANCEAFVLDRNRRMTPIGVPGELYLGGVQVSAGYCGRPDLTAERFIEHPFRFGEFVYRTGDLAKWHHDGHLEFLGRLDRQIQMAGVRIEPAEIELALRRHPSINDAVVLPHRDGTATELVAYVVPEALDKPDPTGVRRHLRAILPLIMIPATFVPIQKMPLTSNGKIDHRALLAHPREDDTATRPPPTPAHSGDLQHPDIVRSIWTRHLRDPWTDDLGFVEAGGDSFTAIETAVEINKLLGATLTTDTVLQCRSLDELLAAVRDNLHNANRPPAHIRPGDPAPHTDTHLTPTSALQERWFALAQRGHGHVNMFAHVQGPLPPELFHTVIASLTARHDVLHSSYLPATPPRQRAIHNWSPPARITDLRTLAHHQVLKAVNAGVQRSLVPFDITREVPFDMELFVLGPEHSLLVGRMHHIATDGWSTTIRLAEFERIYTELIAGRDVSTLPAAPQYKDFAATQRAYLAGPDIDRDRRAFTTMFAGSTGATRMPRVAGQTSATSDDDTADFVNLLYSSAQVNELTDYGRHHGCTLFTVLMSAFAITLGTITKQSDLVFTTSFAGRHFSNASQTLGVFVNPLPVRIHLRAAPDLHNTHTVVRHALLEVTRHQNYLLTDLVRHVPPFVGHEMNDVSHVHLLFQNFPTPSTEGPRRYRLHDFQDVSLPRPFDIPAPPQTLMKEFELIIFTRADNSLSFNFGYKRSRFTHDQVRQWAHIYRTVLGQAIEADTTKETRDG